MTKVRGAIIEPPARANVANGRLFFYLATRASDPMTDPIGEALAESVERKKFERKGIETVAGFIFKITTVAF